LPPKAVALCALCVAQDAEILWRLQDSFELQIRVLIVARAFILLKSLLVGLLKRSMDTLPDFE